MAQIVVAAAGAGIGYAIGGPTGAKIGWALGSALGSSLFAQTQSAEGPRLGDLSYLGSAYGATIPYIEGHPRTSGQVVWASSKRELASTQTSGGKGGGGQQYTSYTYEIDLLIVLSDNPIYGISRVWLDGELVYTSLASSSSSSRDASNNTNKWARLTTYRGLSNQLPDPTYEAAVGTINATAYRGRGSVFIQSLQLGSGGRVPNITFEVLTSASDILPLTTLQCKFANLNDISYYNRGSGFNIAYPYATSTGLPIANNEYVRYPQVVTGSSQIVYVGFTPPARSLGLPATIEMFIEITKSSDNDTAISSTQDIMTVDLGRTPVEIVLAGDVPGKPNYMYIGTFSTRAENNYAEITPLFEFYPINKGKIHYAIVYRASNTCDVYVGGKLWASFTDSFNITSYPTGLLELGGYFQRNDVSQEYVIMKYSDLRVRSEEVYHGSIFVPPSSLGNPDTLSYSPTEPSLQTVVSNLCDRSGLTSKYDVSSLSAITRPVRSLMVSQVTSTRSVLDMLTATHNFDAYLSDKLYFKPRVEGTVVTIPFIDLGSDGASEVMPLSVLNELELPSSVSLTYINVDKDYQTDTQYSDKIDIAQDNISNISVPIGLTPAEAKNIADTQLQYKSSSRTSTAIALTSKYLYLQPADIINVLDDGGYTLTMRVVKVSEQDNMIKLVLVSENTTIINQPTVSYISDSQNLVSLPPKTFIELLDIPILRDADNTQGYYFAIDGENSSWSSAGVYSSIDGQTYTESSYMFDETILGIMATALNSANTNSFDERSIARVIVNNGQLSSVTRDALLNNSTTNAAVIGNELVQFRNAVLVDTNTYELSGFLRGRRGTEWAVNTHQVGERFVLLGTSGIRFVPIQISDINKPKYYKAVTNGQTFSNTTAEVIVPSGVSLECFSPVDARANRSTPNTVITWKRRTRLSTSFVGNSPISVPLGETLERYDLEIYSDNTFTTLKRTFSALTSATVTYTSAQQITDFGTSQSILYIKIYQLSATVGRGYALTTSV